MIIPRYKREIGLCSFINPMGLKRYRDINNTHPFFYEAGTSALYSFLKALNLPEGSIVGVPLYSCYSVWHSVYKAGYTIKFLDIGISSDGYIYDLSIFDDLEVLIFIHYFGYINQERDKIKERNPSLIIMDDLTHVNLYVNLSLKTLDASIYSFNFHKPIVAGSGGILSVKDKSILKRIQEKYNKLDTEFFSISGKKYIKTFIKNHIYTPFIYNILYHFHISKNKDRFIAPDISMSIIPKKNNTIFKMIIGNQIQKYKEDKTLINNYLKLPKKYRLPLKGDEVLSYYPIFFKSEKEKEKHSIFLTKMGFDIYLLWQNCLKTSVYYELKFVDNYVHTNKILNTTIFLPEPLFEKKNKKYLLQLIKELS